MMLYAIIGGDYVGFYGEYGGTVIITGYQGNKPIYSFAGARDEFRVLEHKRGPRSPENPGTSVNELKMLEIATGELSLVLAEYFGVAKAIGPNSYVV